MRPRSLIGPLLLIAVGSLLLLNTLRPNLPILEIFATYWPFLLIAWGALRLVEIISWKIRNRPLPRFGVSGGEWTVIVFICLIGSGLYAANRFRPFDRFGPLTGSRVEVFGRTYDYPIEEQRRPAPAAPRVVIENLRGNVRLTGTPSNEIRVSGRRSIRALQQSDADEASNRTPLEISGSGEEIVIRTNLDRVAGEQRISSHLEISVPRGASVEARGRLGDFEISDVDGAVEINSDNAGVRLNNIAGNVRVRLRRSDIVRVANVKGPVQISSARGRDLELKNIEGIVTIDGAFSGDVEFARLAKPIRMQSAQTELQVERLPGEIRMDLGDFTGKELVGPIRLTTSRPKDISIEGFSNPIEISLGGGDVALRPAALPLAPMQVETRSGNIELALPESAQFQLNAKVNRGEVSNDFESSKSGPIITLNSNRGRISVRKDIGPLVPKPKRTEVEVSIS